jgi:tetratricopeptide (TPR) repeat protein
MKRTAVKKGLSDQRNRATQSRRQKEVHIFRDASKAKFIEWLNESKIGDSNIHQINLTNFLRNTQHFDILSEERLRQLAIFIEPDACSLSGESGWHSLKRIYDYALEFNNKNEKVFLSMGIAAIEIANNLENEKNRKSIFDSGEHAILNAMSIHPNWSHAHYILGYLYYFQGKKQNALDEFEKSLSFENEDKVHSWAQLYKAHCLHDMQRWEQALEAYNSVDLSAFDGLVAWRIDVLREQQAYCTYSIGKKTEAYEMLDKILDRYEAEPKLALDAMSASLWVLAKDLSPEMIERARGIEKMAWEGLL